ncbi:MAG TPA: TfoX/Sxy family protein [Gammaproteobacteria bacterium]|nr:TfoX/Sxy family protein [Gammaproteobacteria bacterium]
MNGKLLNLGPRSNAMLAKAGIHSLDDLRAQGSVQAYLAVSRIWKGASLNLLWALEGAVTGRHWLEVARGERLDLLTRLETAREALAPVARKKRPTRKKAPKR